MGVAIIGSASLGRVSLKEDALALFMAGVMAILMVIYRKYHMGKVWLRCRLYCCFWLPGS